MAPRRLVAMLTVLVLAGCAGSEPTATGSTPTADDATAAPAGTATPSVTAAPASADPADAAWRHLGMVEATLPGMVMAEALTGAQSLEEAWQTYGFGRSEPVPGATPATGTPAPAVDFDHRFVLLLAQPDDNCPDELVGLHAADGELVADWLPPPGGCEQPLIFRLHAIDVHRGHVPSTFAVSPPEHYADDLQRVQISLEPYEGDAPPPPEPPTQMADADLDALFKATGVPRCGPDDLRLGEPQVDGPLSDDPEIAEGQQRRAEYGLPSDPDATRAALENPAPETLPIERDAPMTAAEAEAELARTDLADRAARALDSAGVDRGRDVEILIDRFGRYDDDRGVVVLAAEDEVPTTQEILDAELGAGQVTVTSTGFDPAEQRRVADELVPLMRSGDTGPGAITSTSGSIGPVVIGMVDPTREALEEIAATVDPRLVCVEPQLSGVPQG